jgi:hypothetical protein
MKKKEEKKDTRPASEIQLFKRITVKDKDGKVTYDSGKQRSHSFTLQFLRIIGAHWACPITGGFSISAVNTSGSSPTIPVQDTTYGNYQYHYQCMSAAGQSGVTNFGIVVGTGSTAEANDDYALDTQINHGTGTGELQYGICSVLEPAVSGLNVDMDMNRSFINASGGAVTVNEIGIYVRTDAYNETVHYFCIARDVLASGVSVSDLSTITVDYTLRTT